MSEAAPASGRGSSLATGIYDLGYRPYDGVRLGRVYAMASLFFYTLRAVFGLGRSWVAKGFSLGLAGIALVPALVQLAIAAIIPAEFEYASHEGYFSFINVTLALFCAVTAPEVIGRDQRHHTLALYFSRALSRVDYVTAKAGALIAGLLIVLLVPQVVLLIGNAVATADVVDYLGDNLDQIPPIFVSSVLIAATMGGVALAVACQTPRRAWSTGAVIIFFILSTAMGSILAETITAENGDYAILLSPVHSLEGSVYWIFGSSPPLDSELRDLSVESIYYLAASLGYALVGLGIIYRRYMRLSV